MNTAPERQSGRKAQMSPQPRFDIAVMLKMVLDPIGGTLLTNDGNAILREIDVAHPAAKNMIGLSRTQDEERGDGTTSVIILAGEILAQSLAQLERDIHPVVIISAYNKALKESLEINTSSDEEIFSLIKMSIGTKFVARWSDLISCVVLCFKPSVPSRRKKPDTRYQTVRAHRKRSRRVDRGVACVGRRLAQQGHHAPEHAPKNTATAHHIARPYAGVHKRAKAKRIWNSPRSRTGRAQEVEEE
ncbi:TCP-1/cpn60 chaperonin family-domain-containing protein [Boletus reticuloceps]|uniref:TCP-1/cpn60 chaperonin family-domain-containing protein n=1 Tax=Boletus reticuloceps TaxID=495285 RepID=A0A8I2YE82_9AGAM|nr:TCP-1/cpn60 chaperonin family-domain-containing protein [Boletus reticuloceps]